ncbi:MAG: hypothetical protein QXI60_08735 [Thermofilaceae archaeon]
MAKPNEHPNAPPGYGSGRTVGNGRTTLKLVWEGEEEPPTEVRVITAFHIGALARVDDVIGGCGNTPSTTSRAAITVSGGPGWVSGDGFGNSASASTSSTNTTIEDAKIALSKVWVLPVEYDERCQKYAVKIPYELALQAMVDQDVNPCNSCDPNDPCHPCNPNHNLNLERRIPGTASSVFVRLFDVFTSRDEIYLVSSTSLIDGAEALACAEEFCGMRPVTGQASSPIPFPAVDTVNFGWTYTTSPVA